MAVKEFCGIGRLGLWNRQSTSHRLHLQCEKYRIGFAYTYTCFQILYLYSRDVWNVSIDIRKFARNVHTYFKCWIQSLIYLHTSKRIYLLHIFFCLDMHPNWETEEQCFPFLMRNVNGHVSAEIALIYIVVSFLHSTATTDIICPVATLFHKIFFVDELYILCVKSIV